MSELTIKEKIIATDMLILSQGYLKKILQVSGKTYGIDTLIQYGYIAVIKKGETYYNLLIKSFKNPYILWASYMWQNEYLFGGFDRYNKEWFTTQMSNVFTLYNLKYSRESEILGMKFRFKKVKKEFLYGAMSQKIEGHSLVYMDKERLFIEYVRDYIGYDTSFFSSIIPKLDEKKLRQYLSVYPINKVVHRINSFLCI